MLRTVSTLIFSFLAAILALGLGGCAAAPPIAADRPAAAPEGGIPPRIPGEALAIYLQRAETAGFSGIVLAAQGDSVVFHAAYGPARPASAEPFDTLTPTYIGSLTKQFTAAAILALQDEGRLSVHDSIAQYLSGVPADKRGITIHHLLTHTAGLPDTLGERFGNTPVRTQARIGLPTAAPPTDSAFHQACAEFRRLADAELGLQAVTTDPMYPSDVEELFRRAEAFGFSGGVRLLQDGAPIVANGYGLADRAREVPIGPNTIFDIGSNAKQFTAAAILRLEELGRLRTTDTIGAYFARVPADKRAITLHQLLTHTAGLPHDVQSMEVQPSRDEAVRQILAARLVGSPGERFSYSNVGYALLAAIVEVASGEEFEHFLRERIWLPVGLHHTGMILGELPSMPKAEGYTWDGVKAGNRPERWGPDGPSWFGRGAGWMWSTTSDLARWMEALRTGRVLTAASRQKMFWPHARMNVQQPGYYGYGWAIDTVPDRSCRISHDGSSGIHNANISIYPEHRAVLAMFNTQVRSPWRSFLARVPGVLFGREQIDLPAVSPPPVALKAFAGVYRLSSGGMLHVRDEGGRPVVPWSSVEAYRVFTPLPAADSAAVASLGDVGSSLSMVIRGLAHADYAPLLSRLPPSESPAAEEAFWRENWGEWVDELGPYRDFSIIKTAIHENQLRTYVLVRFARGSRLFGVIHQPDGSLYVDVAMQMPELYLAPSGETVFFTYDLRTKHSSEVRFEERNGERMMIIRNGPESFEARRVSAPQ